jgi:hypothetical protein
MYNCFKGYKSMESTTHPTLTRLTSCLMYITETTAMSLQHKKNQGMHISSYAFSSPVPML